jgi:hypothetical protein
MAIRLPLMLGLACCPSIVGLTSMQSPGPAAPAHASPVVVELFTSEGCSSCPPADGLLSDLGSRGADAPVIILSEHVDYWNRQGWTDPFSSAQFTERQQKYAERLSSEVYTPQMVVDGRRQFIGSDRSQAGRAIHDAAVAPKLNVEVTATAEPGRIATHVAVHPRELAAGGADVLLAITEDGLVSSVSAGENRGRRLSHNGVVRSLKSLGRIKEKGRTATFDATVPLDPHWVLDRLHVIAMVEQRNGGAMLGAGSVMPAAERHASLEGQ